MRIAIVGAGLTGLTAGYRLSRKGNRVTIFEKSDFAGGLAGSFKEKSWDWPLEFYFHHFFTSDKELLDLAEELGLAKKVFFNSPKTSIFSNNFISPFDSPLSVLKSPLLSPAQKIQTALATLYLKVTNNWKLLEKTTASEWLKKNYGTKPYEIIWEPLLKSKFGQTDAEQVSMAWFWGRIKKRSFKLGYFEGGFQILIDSLLKEIKKNNGEVLFNREFTASDFNRGFEKIIWTGPIPNFLKIAPKLPKEYQGRLNNLKMVGAVNLVLVLKDQFLKDNTYWLNINEAGFPFVAVVEHTNFIDAKNYGNNRLLYVGGYYPQNHPYFKMSKEEIYQEFLPYLKKINPAFKFPLLASRFSLHSSLSAQPVIPTSYSKIVPSFTTPLPNVYLATMHHIYPWDRGTNYAVKLGNDVAYEIFKEI